MEKGMILSEVVSFSNKCNILTLKKHYNGEITVPTCSHEGLPLMSLYFKSLQMLPTQSSWTLEAS